MSASPETILRQVVHLQAPKRYTQVWPPCPRNIAPSLSGGMRCILLSLGIGGKTIMTLAIVRAMSRALIMRASTTSDRFLSAVGWSLRASLAARSASALPMACSRSRPSGTASTP